MASPTLHYGVLFSTALLAASEALAEIGFAPTGEVVIPRADCEVVGGKLTARFRATRWGMYSLTAEGSGDTVEATVNGEGPKRERKETLGDFYLAKAGPCAIEVSGEFEEVEALRLEPACEGSPVVQKAGEAIELDAKDCLIEGVMLRYEPNPKKLCIGFWGNPKDSPRWDFTVTTPGRYEVILTQGCGRGAGGSVAVVETAGAAMEFTVEDTGGWQNWKERSLGKVTFEMAGKQVLKVRVLEKARGIMDIRRIVLKPVVE